MRKKNYQIAIDGPVGAGKSTVAKLVAEKLDILYVDTGAMYRAVAYMAKNRGIEWGDEEKISEMVEDIDIQLEPPKGEKKDGRNVTVYLEGKDISWDIRKDDYGEGASVVSQYRKVRKVLVEKQRELARDESVIMEGRDIGTKVLPEAELKIYMDAKKEERVKRKMSQLEKMGVEVVQSEVRQDVETRDSREMSREIDPLRPADDAWIFDTTDLSIEQVVDRIAQKVAQL